MNNVGEILVNKKTGYEPFRLTGKSKDIKMKKHHRRTEPQEVLFPMNSNYRLLPLR
jgi:hypothetical protein